MSTLLRVLLLVSLFLFWTTGRLSSDQAAPASPGNEVVLSGGLSRTEAIVDEPFSFWVTIRNKTAQATSDIRFLRLDSTDYVVKEICWYGAKGETCWRPAATAGAAPGSFSASTSGIAIAANLASGQSLAFWGVLRPVRSHDSQTVTVLILWTNADASTSLSAVDLGRFSVPGAWQRFWAGLKEVINPFKDFVLPAVLVWIGFGFQRRLQKLEDERRKQAEEIAEARRKQERELEDSRRKQEREIEAARLKEDERRTQINQTWNKMLPQSHRLGTRHYMPISGTALETAKYLQLILEERKKGAQADSQLLEKLKRRGYFCFLRLRRALFHLSTHAGGFYFKNRVGEALLPISFIRFCDKYDQGCELVQKNLSALLQEMELNELFSTFLQKLDGEKGVKPEVHTLYQEGWEYFKDWTDSTSLESALPFLQIFQAILIFEMNRPYEHWYGRQEKLRLSPMLVSTVKELGEELSREAGNYGRTTAALVDEYLRESELT